MESGSGLGELPFWYTSYLPWIQQVAFSGLLNAVDPCGIAGYKFDYSTMPIGRKGFAKSLKTGAHRRRGFRPDHLVFH